MFKRISALLLSLLLLLSLTACAGAPAVFEDPAAAEEVISALEEAFLEEPEATEADVAEEEFFYEEEQDDPEELPPETTEAAPEETVVEETQAPVEEATEPETPALDENGSYNTKEEVALYIHLYGHLPSNYISKKEAEKLGWSGGSLEKFAPGKSIGGSRFGNYEGILPQKDGRTYTECDIDTLGKSKRGAKRIVFSNDGLIYYTEDHYETFELLYGEE